MDADGSKYAICEPEGSRLPDEWQSNQGDTSRNMSVSPVLAVYWYLGKALRGPVTDAQRRYNLNTRQHPEQRIATGSDHTYVNHTISLPRRPA